MAVPVLITKRLKLRNIRLSDAEKVSELAGDIKIAKTTAAIPHPYSLTLAKQWITIVKSNKLGRTDFIWVITLHKTRELIGIMSLINYSKENQQATIGYWIGFPFWNNGYCTEAAQEIMNFGFNKLRLTRIFGGHSTLNPPSCRVMVKLGMKKEGVFRKHINKFGVFHDIEYHGILKEEWNTLKKKNV